MFSKKNLSILVAAVLVCAAVVGLIFTGADAGGTSYTWYIDGVGTAEYSYADIDTAMAAAKARTWEEGDTLTIYVTKSGTATNFNTKSTGGNADTGRHLFNVITIFRGDNTKLPITINGDDPATSTVEKNTLLLGNTPVWNPASSTAAKNSFAATNDYTFKNLDLSSWAQTSYFFYAGSGMVTFDNVNLGESTSAAQTMTITPSVGGWTPFKNWTPDQFNTCADDDGLLSTGFSFKNTNYGANNGTLACRITDTGISKGGQPTGGGLTIETPMLKNKLILGEGCTVANVNHHGADSIDIDGFQPAESIIEIDGATVGNLYSVRGAFTGVGNKITAILKSGSVNLFRMGPNGEKGKYTGDMEVKWTGGTVTEFWGACSGTVDGDVTLTVEGVSPTFADGKMIGSTVTGTVTQNIKNCNLQGEVYLGANGKAANVVNNLSGTINTTDYYAYLGANSQTISGNLTNNISCDWNYTGDQGEKHLFCGSFTGAIGGKITNNITTGADIDSMFYGGSRQANVGSIENNITDGIFQLNFFGGNRDSGTIGSVTTTISGGTFKATSYLSSRGGTVATSENNISGGTFNSGVYMGANFASITTSLTSTVSGGTFKSKLYNSSASGSITTKTLTIKPEGTKLALHSALEGGCTEFIGNSATVKIGSGTTILADKASGSVTFHQIGAWNTNTYFDASSGSIAITATQDKGVTGKVTVNGNTVTGMTEMLFGTSFVFNNKVSMTFYFLKTAVDATDPEGFNFVVKAEKGRKIANASLADIKASPVSGKYYAFTTSPLIASEMAYSISYEGSAVPAGTLNLLDLAAQGAKMAKEAENTVLENLYLSYANYAVSVRNYLAKNAGGEAWDLPTADTAPVVPEFAPEKGPLKLIDSPKITMYARSLILTDGIVIRYYGQGPSNTASNYTLYVNNQKMSGAFTYVSGATYPLRMDIPISVTEGETRLRITIKDANGKAHFDFVDRLDRLAYELGLVGEVEMGNEALYYFQSAVAYQKDVLTKTVLNTTLPTEFSAGYSTVDATPYGTAATINGDKLGVDTKEPIHVTCVAMADGNAEDTVLYLSIPARKVPDNFVKNATKFVSESTGVKPENIFFNATHSHSAPNITAGMGAPGIKVWYNEYLYPAAVLSAQEAILDLAPSTAYSGTAKSDIGVGIVRRYFNKAGDFCSIQKYYRERATGTPGTYESDIDREMRTIRFERQGKKPILLVNWQGHAASAVGYLLVDPVAAKVSDLDVDEAYISPDFIYYLRQGLADKGYLAAFFNGGTGDINFAEPPFTGSESWIKNSTQLTAAQKQEHIDRWNAFVDLTGYNSSTKTYVTHVHEAFGKSLVQTALTANSSAVKVNTGTIKTETVQEEVTVRKDPAQLVDSARLCKNYGTEAEGRMAYNMYGFDSGLEVTHTIKRNDTLDETDEIPLSVVTFGDVAMSFASYEMFHESASALRKVSPYKVNFVCGYTNGDDGYMPTNKGFDNGGYEHYACFYIKGTAEQCNDSLLAMLNEHKN